MPADDNRYTCPLVTRDEGQGRVTGLPGYLLVSGLGPSLSPPSAAVPAVPCCGHRWPHIWLCTDRPGPPLRGVTRPGTATERQGTEAHGRTTHRPAHGSSLHAATATQPTLPAPWAAAQYEISTQPGTAKIRMEPGRGTAGRAPEAAGSR